MNRIIVRVRRFLALLVVGVAMMIAVPVMAAPPAGDFFIPISARYIDDLGVGAGLGWQSRESKFMVMGQVTWDRIDGVSGVATVPPREHGSMLMTNPRPPRTVPFSTSDRSEVGVTLTFAIPIVTRHGKAR